MKKKTQKNSSKTEIKVIDDQSLQKNITKIIQIISNNLTLLKANDKKGHLNNTKKLIISFYLTKDPKNPIYLHGMWPSNKTREFTEFMHRTDIENFLWEKKIVKKNSEVDQLIEKFENRLIDVVRDFIYFVYKDQENEISNNLFIRKIFPFFVLENVGSVFKKHAKDGFSEEIDQKSEDKEKFCNAFRSVGFSSINLAYETIKHFGSFRNKKKKDFQKIYKILDKSLLKFYQCEKTFPFSEFIFGKKNVKYKNSFLTPELKKSFKKIIGSVFYYIHISNFLTNTIFDSKILGDSFCGIKFENEEDRKFKKFFKLSIFFIFKFYSTKRIA